MAMHPTFRLESYSNLDAINCSHFRSSFGLFMYPLQSICVYTWIEVDICASEQNLNLST